MTNPLLDRLPDETLGGHWLVSRHSGTIRDGRYAALRAVAATSSPPPVRPCSSPRSRLSSAVAGNGTCSVRPRAPPTCAWCTSPATTRLFASRRAQRSEERDQHRIPAPPAPPPAVPVVTVDGELNTAQQLLRVLAALGRREAVDTSNALFDRDFDAVLFDLDGTLADSTASVLRSWRQFAGEYAIPAQAVESQHGRPARDLIGEWLPPELADRSLARIIDLEVADARSVQPTLGAPGFFRSVPEQRRAIVTSGPARLATARIRAVGLPVPAVMVTADDVRHGKPDPEPYRLAAQRMGVDPRRCLVVEDTVVGLRAARAAGCAVIAVTGTARAGELHEADLVVDGLDQLRLVSAQGTLRLAVGPDRQGVPVRNASSRICT